MGAAGGEQAGDGAFLFLADDGGDGLGEQVLRGAHVLAVLGRLVEAGAGPGVGQVAPDAEPFQAVERLLGLGERQQDRAVVAHMHDVVRGERVTRLDGLQRRLAHGAQAEDDARRDGGFAAALRGGDGERAKRQAFQLPGVFLEEPRQVDAEVVQGEVGDGDAAATGLRGR